MTEFNPRNMRHRMQMLQLVHALALEINTGLRTKINFFQHAKALGWVDPKTRQRKQALEQLVTQAVRGFGYVPKGNIKRALPMKVGSKKVAA